MILEDLVRWRVASSDDFKRKQACIDFAFLELASEITKSESPFPPLLCAAGLDTLLAQTYVSSHPLSGLLLVDPPLSIKEALARKPGIVDPSMPEFDYEPFFPIALLTSRSRAEAMEKHRLRQDYSEETRLLVSPDDDIFGDDGVRYVMPPLYAIRHG
jgi:hypothetical protein